MSSLDFRAEAWIPADSERETSSLDAAVEGAFESLKGLWTGRGSIGDGCAEFGAEDLDFWSTLIERKPILKYEVNVNECDGRPYPARNERLNKASGRSKL